MQNLEVPLDLYSVPSFSVEQFADPVFDSEGLAGFKSWAMVFYLTKLLVAFLPSLYPEWPHRQGIKASHAAVARSIHAEVALIYTMHEALRGYCHESGGATSQLDLPSLTLLSVAGCG